MFMRHYWLKTSTSLKCSFIKKNHLSSLLTVTRKDSRYPFPFYRTVEAFIIHKIQDMSEVQKKSKAKNSVLDTITLAFIPMLPSTVAPQHHLVHNQQLCHQSRAVLKHNHLSADCYPYSQ